MNLTKYSRIVSFFLFLFTLSSCIQQLPLADNILQNEVESFMQSLVGKTSQEQSEIAAKVWSNSAKSMKVRDRATYILASRNNKHTKVAQSSLNAQYYQSDDNYKKYMEETFFHDLNGASNADISANLKLITPKLEPRFPYNMLIFTAAKRDLLPNSKAILEKFKTHNYFKSPVITLEKTPSANYVTAKGGVVAMLLPQSGTYSSISKQIRMGAEIAQTLLQQQGINWQIIYVDTQDPNWLQYLQNLPKECVVVGGPLQTNIYQQLVINKLVEERAYFTFLSRLPDPNREGIEAWRFFTSQEDQISAVLRTAQNDLGITRFGSFYPNTSYGKAMNNLFTKMAQERGMTVYSKSYPSNDYKAWNKISQEFLDTRTPQKGKLPIARRPIDAIFFPDVWKQMDFLISYMHYYGGHKKVMFGTSLWEQSLNHAININPETFGMTLFPVSYDPYRESPYKEFFEKELSKRNSIGTDWIELGFDFVLLSSRLQLDKKLPADEINKMLYSLKVDYLGAPFIYSSKGKVFRELIMNLPARSGRMPYDKETFLEYKKTGKELPNLDEVTKENREKEKQEDELDLLINSILN